VSPVRVVVGLVLIFGSFVHLEQIGGMGIVVEAVVRVAGVPAPGALTSDPPDRRLRAIRGYIQADNDDPRIRGSVGRHPA
jgi:hypothetical protein